MNLIPTFDDAYYTEVVNLAGVDYLLTFAYNQREDCYFLSIATPDGQDIVNGIKLVANWPLIDKFADERLPPGDLFLWPNTPVSDPAPGLGMIGEGRAFTLYYMTPEEVEEIGITQG